MSKIISFLLALDGLAGIAATASLSIPAQGWTYEVTPLTDNTTPGDFDPENVDPKLRKVAKIPIQDPENPTIPPWKCDNETCLPRGYCMPNAGGDTDCNFALRAEGTPVS